MKETTIYHEAHDLIIKSINIVDTIFKGDNIKSRFYINKYRNELYHTVSLVDEDDDVLDEKIFNNDKNRYIKGDNFSVSQFLPYNFEDETFEINIETDLVKDENNLGYLLLTSKFSDIYTQSGYFITIRNFDFDEVFDFVTKNDVQIKRHDDYQYKCIINKSCYTTDIDPLSSMVLGIKMFKSKNE